jgi:hypothetical protein
MSGSQGEAAASRDGLRWRLYAQALAIYAASRLVIAMAIVFARHYVPPACSGGPCAAQTPWTQHLLRWDAGWYQAIALNGYSYSGDPHKWTSVVFYPLYPYLSRALAALTGIWIGDALLIVSNLAALAAILALVRLLADRFGDAATLTTVALLSFFPTSFFFSAGYTESLSLLLCVLFFLQLKTGNLPAAAGFAALATATRPTGIVLVPVLLWELWQRHGRDPRRFVLLALAAAIVATSGLWLYMLYLGLAFGDPLLFSKGQAAWHGDDFWGRLWSALTLKPVRSISLRFRELRDADPFYFVAFAVLAILCWRRLSVSFALFASGVLLLPYLTLAGGPSRFTSMHRFVLLAFPAFLVLALLCEGRRWLAVSLIGLFAAGLFLYTALFSQAYWIV